MVLPLQVDEEETVGEGDLLGGVVVLLEVREELAAFVHALKPGEVCVTYLAGNSNFKCTVVSEWRLELSHELANRPCLGEIEKTLSHFRE